MQIGHNPREEKNRVSIPGALAALVALLIFYSLPGSAPLFALDVKYARYPALSPDGKTIAFSFRGDLWLVPASGGEAKRLTVHEAEDIMPQFSPDGTRIAFSSRRFNNYDIYTIPVAGGTPTRLTFDTEDDYASCWTPGSDSVLFMSTRESRGDVFKVAAAGGTPVKLTGDYYEREFGAKLSASGRYMTFITGSGFVRWWRRDLRTGGNSDVFVWDRSKRDFDALRLTDEPTHEIWPIINETADEVYFVANHDDTWAQVHRVGLQGGESVKLTNFADDGVQWLNSNPDGSILVFEQGFKIWTLDPSVPGAQPQAVKISITTDEKGNSVERKSLGSEVQWFSLSPDDKKIAAVMQGDIYVLASDEPSTARRVTTTQAREVFPEWAPDSKAIYYSSERNGNYDIFKYDFTTNSETQLTDTPESERKPLPSPDGKYLAYFRGVGEIIRRDLNSGTETIWATGNFADFGLDSSDPYDWSPDSRYLAFMMTNPSHDIDIFAVDLNGKIENVSQFINWNGNPHFSADGKKLYFSSWTRWTQQTYEVDLIPEPIEFDEAEIDSLFLQAKKDDKEKKKAKETDEADKPAPVRIDTFRIAERRKKAFSIDAANYYPVLTPDGSKYLFVSPLLGKPEIWSIDAEEKKDLEQLTHSEKGKDYLQVSSDSKWLYYLESGAIRKLKIENGKSEKLSFDAEMLVDRVSLNKQKFYEGWRMLSEYFYDPTFRGTNWQAARDKYAPLLDQVRTELEFSDVMMEMMGELRGSHLHYYDQAPGTGGDDQTGRLGIEFDQQVLERDGQFKIARVLPGSPAARAGIKADQYITAINGVELNGSVNLASLLAGTIGDRVMVNVSNSPAGVGAALAVKPVNHNSWTLLKYEDWVENNRRVVDSLSNGRIAYLHIRAMNQTALDRFEEELVSLAEGKDALLVDVRENGGGWIAVHLLGMLERQPYAMRTFRDFPPTSENKHRAKAWEEPMALLINGYSGSNSEIFAEGFRQLKLGPIIGTPTGGGVIGTSAYELLDGSRIRRPSWGAYTVDMEDTDIYPRQPDLFVDRLPNDYMNGRDPQLERAVEELLKQIE